MPVESAPAKPSGLPTAMTSSPGRSAAESPGVTASSPVAEMRSDARSRRGSRPTTRAGKRRPSQISISVLEPRATCALVRMSPSEVQMTPDPPLRRSARQPSSSTLTRTVERLRRSPISPNPRISAPPRPFPDDHVNAARLAAAQHFHLHLPADHVTLQHKLDIVGVLHRLPAAFAQDVADENAGAGGGARGFKRKHDQAFLMIGQFHGLQPDSEIAASHASASQDFIHHAIHGDSRNGEARDARERAGGDADR